MPTASPASPQHSSAASSSSTGSAPRSAARARTGCTPTPAPTTSSVKTVRELLRRHPELPPERIDEVAIAATTQQGDQGLTLGRTVGVLAGLPRSVPGYAIDRMCAGAMTAVTNTAAAIGFGAQDVALAGGVEHMGHHPMGFDADPNPRFLSERLVGQRRPEHGRHRREPARQVPRADAGAGRRVRRRQPGQVRRGAGRRQDRPRPGPGRAARPGARLGPGHRRRAAAPGHHRRGDPEAADAVPRGRPRDRRHRRPADRRRRVLPARRRGDRRRAGPADAHAPGVVRVRRRRARDHGHRPGPGHRQGARAARACPSRTSACSRSTRRSPSRCCRSSTRSASPTTTPASTSTAARSPSVTRWPRPACA